MMTYDYVTLNIFDKRKRLVAVCVCHSETAAQFAFERSEHNRPGYHYAIYSLSGATLAQKEVPC